LINARVEQAGKDASERRAAMRDVFALGVQHYRRQMRDEVREDQLAQMTLDRLDRCIRALREVDRNANQTTLIECFSADIAAGISQDLGEIG
jgi:DNA polymerase-3 subunit delta'